MLRVRQALGQGRWGLVQVSASSGQGPSRPRVALTPTKLGEEIEIESSSNDDDFGLPEPKLCDHLGWFGSLVSESVAWRSSFGVWHAAPSEDLLWLDDLCTAGVQWRARLM